MHETSLGLVESPPYAPYKRTMLYLTFCPHPLFVQR